MALLAAQQYYVDYGRSMDIDELKNSLVMYIPEDQIHEADENCNERWLQLVLHAFRKVVPHSLLHLLYGAKVSSQNKAMRLLQVMPERDDQNRCFSHATGSRYEVRMFCLCILFLNTQFKALFSEIWTESSNS